MFRSELLRLEGPASRWPDDVDTIGNLTLLTSPLNSSVGNGPIAEKLKVIGEHSLPCLNRAIRVEGDRWAEDEILERGRKFFEYARVIWSPPPGQT